MMIINNEGEDDQTVSEKYANALCAQHPGNLLYQYYCFKVLLLQNKKPEALERLKALNVQVNMNKELTVKQKIYFPELAKKDLEEYYKKSSK